MVGVDNPIFIIEQTRALPIGTDDSSLETEMENIAFCHRLFSGIIASNQRCIAFQCGGGHIRDLSA